MKYFLNFLHNLIFILKYLDVLNNINILIINHQILILNILYLNNHIKLQ